MSDATCMLPDFERPPVTEVVLAVRFDPSAAAMTSPELATFWDRHLRTTLPRSMTQAPLPLVIERFGGRQAVEPDMAFLLGSSPVPRFWFLNKPESELVQLQPDLFAHNWRKVESSPTYPRYSALRLGFADELSKLVRFVTEDGRGRFNPVQCEVTYVNHLVAGTGWNHLGELDQVFRFLRRNLDDPDFRAPEGLNGSLHFVIADPGSQKPLGRLHASVEPGQARSTGQPVCSFTLTARGRPLSEDVAGTLAFIDLGHERIVRGFAAMTTEAMHSLWGRRP